MKTLHQVSLKFWVFEMNLTSSSLVLSDQLVFVVHLLLSSVQPLHQVSLKLCVFEMSPSLLLAPEYTAVKPASHASVTGCKTTTWHQFSKFIHIFSGWTLIVISHSSFACMILMFNLKIPVELDPFGLKTCARFDFRGTGTPPWIVAVYVWIVGQQAWVCRRGWLQDWKGRWERTCAGGQCQVRQGTRHDAWMTDCFRHTNPWTWATHVRLMKSVMCWHTVRICTCCMSGCSVHTSRRLSGSLSPGNRNWS